MKKKKDIIETKEEFQEISEEASLNITAGNSIIQIVGNKLIGLMYSILPGE